MEWPVLTRQPSQPSILNSPDDPSDPVRAEKSNALLKIVDWESLFFEIKVFSVGTPKADVPITTLLRIVRLNLRMDASVPHQQETDRRMLSDLRLSIH